MNSIFLTWIAENAAVRLPLRDKTARYGAENASPSGEINPHTPNLGGMEQTQRGFAPLHAPIGATREAQLVMR